MYIFAVPFVFPFGERRRSFVDIAIGSGEGEKKMQIWKVYRQTGQTPQAIKITYMNFQLRWEEMGPKCVFFLNKMNFCNISQY